jgi:hypothetical protein
MMIRDRFIKLTHKKINWGKDNFNCADGDKQAQITAN